jgi:hypothetical protein
MTKKLPLHEKISRKPISRACSFCHSKHIQCDHARPCKNCIKRGIQDHCRDVERKKAKYLADDEKGTTAPKKRAGSSVSLLDGTPSLKKKSSANESFTPILLPNGDATPPPSHTSITNIPTTTSTSTTMATPSVENMNIDGAFLPATRYNLDSVGISPLNSSLASNVAGNSSTAANLQKRIAAQGYESSPDAAFSSLFANQEYSQLADLLDNNIELHSPSQSSVHTNTNYANNEFQTSFQSENNTRPYISLSDNSTQQHLTDEAVISNSLQNDVQEPYYTSPLILRHLIQQPEDVYTTRIQPYNYPMAYHVLLNYLKTRFKREQLIQIAGTMAEYRPSFIAATRSLVEMDLLFAERSFQRSLLEYESMSSLSSSPTIMWRRSGEIVAVSTEFSSLTAHTKTSLISKRTFIVELMNDKSALDYFKLFSSVAFGDLNGVIITECTLLSPSGEEIRCASTWTVKRDVFDIPMLVVGQFLPILQVR